MYHIFVLWGKISRPIDSKGRAKSYLVYPYVKHKPERVNLAVTQYFFLSVLQEDPFFKDSNVRKEEFLLLNLVSNFKIKYKWSTVTDATLGKLSWLRFKGRGVNDLHLCWPPIKEEKRAAIVT